MSAHITVKVIPGARQTKIAGLLGGVLKIRVQAPPEKGKANIAVIDTLAAALALSPRQISIISGHSSQTKVVAVQGVSDAELTRRVSELAS